MPTKPKTHNPLPVALQQKLAAQQVVDKKRAAYQYDHTPERQADLAFYRSVVWVRFREYAMAQPENAVCRHCRERGVIAVATQLDHIKPRKEHPELSLVLENVQGLCASCHARKTRQGA